MEDLNEIVVFFVVMLLTLPLALGLGWLCLRGQFALMPLRQMVAACARQTQRAEPVKQVRRAA